ncbi:MAG: hypothetical protein JWO38_7849 [Gemmataceae bacterium]|nr:hypothetical protein [Gemmataceae bacterium]
MMRCDHCRSLLLDHLYGLLDPAEAAAVEGHLTTCPDCTAARAQAARAQDLIALAARTSFPDVRFTPPVGHETVPAGTAGNGRPVPETTPATPAGAPRPARRGTWARWAVAAGVLAMIPGTLIPLSGRAGRYEAARRAAETTATRLADAKSAVDHAVSAPDSRYAVAKANHAAVLADWVAAETAAARAEKDETVAVAVTKPLAVQPGAPNDFVISVHDRGTALQGSRVEAQVRDQAGTVLFSQAIDPERRGDTHRVRVPAEVWSRVEPQTELFLSVAAVDEKTTARRELRDQIRLYGPVYATMLVTDKASYRPGEWVYFRSLTLDRVTFRPPAREQKLHYSLRRQDGPTIPGAAVSGSTAVVRVADGTVEPITGPDGSSVRGVGCGAFALPADLGDGDYFLTLTEQPGPGGIAPLIGSPVTRTVKVRAGVAERYTKEIKFTAASFAPGQGAEAWVEAKFRGAPLVGAKVTAVATADGKPIGFVRVIAPTTGPDGRVKVVIPVPPQNELTRGDVRLKVTFRTPEAEESVADRVPVTGKDVTIEFFPEGGKLIAGIPNRVYVRGTTTAGRPVDVRGVITDGTEVVARVDSPADAGEPGVNRGLGSFSFTPKADTAYRLKLQTPGPGEPAAGFDVPPAERDGVAMTVLDPMTAPGEPVRVRLYSGVRARTLVVGAYTRGRLADTQKVTAEPGKPVEVKLLATPDLRGGVTRVTVFEEAAQGKMDLIPVAERLVFRKPGEVLNLSLGTGPAAAGSAPGSPVDLTVAATDEKGTPVPAILWAAVVNTAVAPGAKDRSLPTHFLLAGEVQTPDELEHADFLLTAHPKAAVALDHVLATQGWRRFVEQIGTDGMARLPAAQRGPDAEHLLAMNGQVPVAADAAGKRRPLFEAYLPRYETSATELEAAQKAKDTAADRSAESVVGKLLVQYEDRRKEMTDVTAAVRSAAESLVTVRNRMGLVAGILAMLVALFGVLTLTRGGGVRGALPLFVGATGAAGLGLFLFFSWNEPEAAGPDYLAEYPPPAHPVPPGTTDATPSFKSGPEAPKSQEPDRGGPVAKGVERVKPEPGVSSGIGTRPPPAAQMSPMIAPRNPGVPGATTIPGMSHLSPGADARKLIPDDLLRSNSGMEKGGIRQRAGGVSLVPASGAEEKAATAFAEKEASRLARRMKEAFGGEQPVGPDQDAFNRVLTSILPTRPLVVREYAAPRPGTTSGDPLGDGDTVLWQPVIVLPTDGKTRLRFHLGNAPGGYQVMVAGHTPDGRLGTVRTVLTVAPAGKNSPAQPK